MKQLIVLRERMIDALLRSISTPLDDIAARIGFDQVTNEELARWCDRMGSTWNGEFAWS